MYVCVCVLAIINGWLTCVAESWQQDDEPTATAAIVVEEENQSKCAPHFEFEIQKQPPPAASSQQPADDVLKSR